MSLKDHRPDDQVRDRLRDYSSPVHPDAWHRIQNGLTALRTQPGAHPSQLEAIPVLSAAAPETTGTTPSHPEVAAPSRRRTAYRPYLALICAACLILFVARPYLRHHASPVSPVSPAEASAKAGQPANSLTLHTPSHTSSTASSPEKSPTPSPAASTNLSATSSPALPHDGSSILNPNPSSKEFRTGSTPSLTHVNRRHRPAAQKTNGSLVSMQSPQALFPIEPSSPATRPAVPLPALAKFAGRKDVTAQSPKPFQHPAKPNPDAGLRFFDHFYLSLFAATDFPTHYYALSYTGGVRLTFQFNSHWSATSGIQLSRINFRSRQNFSDSDVVLLPRYFLNLDLPLLVGYTFAGNHYNFTINGGAIISLYSRAYGPYLRYRWPSGTGPSAYLDLAYTRPLNDQWSVFAEPYVRCMFTNSKSLLPSQTWSAGLQLGLKYHL